MVALASPLSSLYGSNLSSIKQNPCPSVHVRTLGGSLLSPPRFRARKLLLSRRFTVFAVTEGSSKSKKEGKTEESVPSWAKPGSVEPPPWARAESSQGASQQNLQIPFFVYLLASAITAIAAIGSVFEYVNQKPVFGVLSSDNIFYAPVLGFFAFTGIPTSRCYGGSADADDTVPGGG